MTEIDQKALEAASKAYAKAYEAFNKQRIDLSDRSWRECHGLSTPEQLALGVAFAEIQCATTSNAAETAKPAGGDELADLVNWVDLWNRVCATAWGDDDKPPPPWSEVAAKELSDWNLRGLRDADAWGDYMRQRLILAVEAYLYKIGSHPSNTAPQPLSTSSGEDRAAIITTAASVVPLEQAGDIRVCPERDGKCPHGMACPYTQDRYHCDIEASRAAIRKLSEKPE